MPRMILPVFFHVDPTDIEQQTGSFGDAFWKLKELHNKSMNTWRNALKEAACISGRDSTHHRPDSKLVEVVVKDVKDILNKLYQMSPVETSGFVGVESSIQEIESLLFNGKEGVQFVGIWGMGGIGKSIRAEVLYHRSYSKFDGCCFLANVRENLDRHGPISLLEKLISRILKNETVHIESYNVLPESIKLRLRNRKVLIVLDDVNDVTQLDCLVGNGDWFASGSRIIITSRDHQVLNSKVDEIYKVEGLCYYDALQLFSLNAFNQKHPFLDYMELSERAVNYAKGVPLALKVLGSHLRKRSLDEWEASLDKLTQTPDSNIQKVLKISYDELEKRQKDIFLDIACFFKGYKKNRIENILSSSDHNARWGIIRLVDKCLVSIVDDQVEMHDLIQEMGWEIAEESHIRLWKTKDTCRLLAANTGKETIEGMFLNMHEVGSKVYLKADAFSGMDNLRILKFFMSSSGNLKTEDAGIFLELSWSNYFQHFLSKNRNSFHCLPNKLSLLHWEKYPCSALPYNFGVENLVELDLSKSQLEQLWDGDKCPRKLRRLCLTNCVNLKNLPNLSSALDMEMIDLRVCKSLLEIPSYIQYYVNLNSLDLSQCNELRSIPSLVGLKSLKYLDLCGCYCLKILPLIPRGIEVLKIDECGLEDFEEMKEWFASLKSLPNLRLLSMSNCKNLVTLPSLAHLKSLKFLDLSRCSNLKTLPEIPQGIEFLHLNDSGLEELSSSLLVEPHNLEDLYVSSCENLTDFPDSQIQIFNGCSTLGELPVLIYGLFSLRELYLDGTALVEIPSCFISLPSLRKLSLNNCMRLQALPELPEQLRQLQAVNCQSLGFAKSPSIQAPEKSSFELNYADWFEDTAFKFNYCNCVNLVCNDIVADAMLRINSIATASEYFDYIVCFPGSEIPREFECRKSGSSVSADMPPYYHDKGVDFAFCAVVEFEDLLVVESLSFLILECHVYGKRRGVDVFDDRIAGHLEVGDVKCNLQSDHVFIWYSADKYFWDADELSFEFSAIFSSISGKLKVKKCGTRITSSLA
ncbi:disease resistance-like protein DSC1 isoform X2 [Mercurialis annua]|nr:disease resistance-like protein DSC1 isoform X2 [Mercurialis annua]